MNRTQFLLDPYVRAFLQYLGPQLLTWHVNYISAYKRILAPDRPFNAVGVQQALTNYVWPASFNTPTPIVIGGVTYAAGSTVSLYRWPETLQALCHLQNGLRASIAHGTSALPWCNAILQWGLGSRMRAASAILSAQGAGLEPYLANMQLHCQLATVDIADLSPPLIHMNSGLAKVHSLASVDGLVIFDSRVAHALGKLINGYCNLNSVYPIPAPLRIFSTGGRTPPPVIQTPSGQMDNHAPFPTQKYNPAVPGTNAGWMDAQIRVSWLIAEALTLNPHIFPGLAAGQRCHQLEAAFFMLGA
jgi:hypothetical protein